jgi:molybdenum cofactor cytidylyltransferase
VSAAGLILAAGESSRMGSPKALLEFQGETFVDRLIRCFSSCCSPVIVVLGHEPEMIRAGVRAAGKSMFVLNPDYQFGQFSSMQCGLKAVPGDAEGVAFMPVAIPQYAGRHGHPVWIAQRLIPEFLALPPDAQARTVIHRHAREIEYIDVADPGILDDVDDPEAYRRLLESA